MQHEAFPVAGFEFMDEPATEQQKNIICELATQAGKPIDRDGQWPTPFTKWDAKNMIEALEGLPIETCDWHPEHGEDDVPRGERCGVVATHRIAWLDGSERYSFACSSHLDLDQYDGARFVIMPVRT